MDDKRCFLCGMNGASDPLDKHHIFGGPYRKKSEKYGLYVYLCHRKCHIFGAASVHQNVDQMRRLKRYGQIKAMTENNWTKAEFISHFGRNYLEG